MKKIVHVHNIAEWGRLKEEASGAEEIIVFKFSPFCGSSYTCERLVDEWFDRLEDDKDLVCVKIDVIASRPLSQYIAEEYNIRHESPQAIWLDLNGTVKWHDSHFSITEETLSGLLN